MKKVKKKKIYKIACPYCGVPVPLIDNKDVYGTSYGTGKMYRCSPCDAHVGCHPDGKPYGTLANKELRRWRAMAHAHFDPLWKSRKVHIARSILYRELASHLGLKKHTAHIGMFDVAMCKKVILFAKNHSWSVSR